MKREIKFRAWDSLKNRWYEPTFEGYRGIIEEIMLSPRGRLTIRTMTELIDESMFPNRFEIMQYTGLHDKNGREVYEGDVLDIGLRNQDGKPVIAPVSYETYAAGYVLDNGGNGIWQRLTKDCEVIGNIFENTELLEVTDHD
ncbi:YopX family protein [Lacticaseibacillus paracasei]|uniref:YopX family protein n=1 Tax=Lacticaseibacillus paracasei TaxID=1597 RepID=UPI0020196406|nr:YopX family protein [Lacticaseibacillus paracasei]MCL4173990.1 YopX family protein [Lacticaseibacillus paracasei]